MRDAARLIEEKLGQLLPEKVLFEVGVVTETEGDLLAEEAEQAQRYGEKRLAEFRASRVLSRRLLTRLGAEPGPILNGSERQPLWPADFVGSLSHSGGLAIVVMASKTDFSSLGVDVEMSPELKRDLWKKILLPEEEKTLGALADEDAGRLALLYFSAKESFYKAQHPLTGTFLGFEALGLKAPDERGHLPCTIHDQAAREQLQEQDLQLSGVSTPDFALSFCCFQHGQ